ncbi:peptide-methionine (S)-S-oxide reductase MsrA [Lichenicoccus roseus]|uniref:Peptide methionine sulfoxide reductase MsrA n=1 Tax=Lichenicoccus roseus TaxID=2683649 RepID=A0A5R9J8B1_9PROT|nr:peptide-methionine (S)-S-oxide reductase MsrA [Lichenicoccus roseus]TLU72777.1 peptide-methionine (S)-S-oxide reductase MsrA [Lichenicoccus roseus]
MAIATLGGGCFWCVEAVYKDLEGVSAVLSGYAGGTVPHPSYEQVCTGTTGHAEVVQVTYDAAVLSYADLLRIFFTIHDPTTLNRQGNDVGTQYRSVIFVGDDEERRVAESVRDEIDAATVWNGSIVTEIAPLPAFYPAEAEHHDYFALHPGAGYCRVVIAPKVAKFRKAFRDRLKQGAA